MEKAIKFAVVAVCLICILALCIAPFADLPATNLRSYQMAIIMIWGLVATAFCLVLSLRRPLVCKDATWFDPAHRNSLCIAVPPKVFSILRC